MTQLPSAADLYSYGMKQLQGWGNAQAGVDQQNYQNALGTAEQQMAASGLAGTSVAPSMAMGYMKQYQNALSQLGQTFQGMQLQAASTLGLGGIQSQQAQQGLDIQRQGQANQLALGYAGINASANANNNRMATDQAAQQDAYSLAVGQQNAGGGGETYFPGSVGYQYG